MKNVIVKKGISLILLIITIVVIIIIINTIMVAIKQNSPSKVKDESTFKSEVEAFNNMLNFWLQKEAAFSASTFDISTVNATKTYGDYNNMKIQDIITTMDDDYASEFEIQKGKLTYVGQNETVSAWAKQIGVGRRTHLLSDANDYVIYYSATDIFLNEKIRNKDVAILDAVLYKASDIEYIKSSGTVVLGYIPISQVNINDVEFINLLKPEDYIYENGIKKTINNGGVYITNLNSQHYCDVFMQLVKTRIMDRGFNGIFIDGLDYLESKDNEKEYTQYKVQYENILKLYRRLYSNGLIMQNGGFKIATEINDIHLDAILWDNFKSYEGNVSSDETQISLQIKQLQIIGTKVFAVSNSSNNISKENLLKVQEYAIKSGYTYYYTPYDNYSLWPF